MTRTCHSATPHKVLVAAAAFETTSKAPSTSCASVLIPAPLGQNLEQYWIDQWTCAASLTMLVVPGTRLTPVFGGKYHIVHLFHPK